MSFLDRFAPQPLTLEQQIVRANHAAILLRDEVLQAALDETEFVWLSKWHDTNDPAVQARCHAVVHALGEVRRTLDKFVGDGQLAGSRAK